MTARYSLDDAGAAGPAQHATPGGDVQVGAVGLQRVRKDPAARGSGAAAANFVWIYCDRDTRYVVEASQRAPRGR